MAPNAPRRAPSKSKPSFTLALLPIIAVLATIGLGAMTLGAREWLGSLDFIRLGRPTVGTVVSVDRQAGARAAVGGFWVRYRTAAGGWAVVHTHVGSSRSEYRSGDTIQVWVIEAEPQAKPRARIGTWTELYLPAAMSITFGASFFGGAILVTVLGWRQMREEVINRIRRRRRARQRSGPA
jgi:hypothetical protein